MDCDINMQNYAYSAKISQNIPIQNLIKEWPNESGPKYLHVIWQTGMTVANLRIFQNYYLKNYILTMWLQNHFYYLIYRNWFHKHNLRIVTFIIFIILDTILWLKLICLLSMLVYIFKFAKNKKNSPLSWCGVPTLAIIKFYQLSGCQCKGIDPLWLFIEPAELVEPAVESAQSTNEITILFK